MRFFSPIVALVMALVAAGVCASGLAPDSLARWEFVGDAQIAPDGERIVYAVTRVDRERDAYDTDLWLIAGDAKPRPLAQSPSDDHRPRWSPDGRRVAFLSNRAGKPQVFVLELSEREVQGGEAWPLTAEAEGVTAFEWSPDGSRIAFRARRPPVEVATSAARVGGVKAVAGRAKVTDRLYYRTDGAPGFLPEDRGRLFVVDVREGHATPIGPLTDGVTEPSDPVWSGDGRALYYSAAPLEERPIDGDSELWRVEIPLAGSEAARPVAITDRRGPDASPVVDAGHRRIAWTGYDYRRPDRMASATTRLYLAAEPLLRDAAARVAPTLVAGDLDRNVSETVATDAASPRGAPLRPAFSGGGRSLYFVAADRGRARLFSASTRGGDVRAISPDDAGDVRDFSVSRRGRIAATVGSPTRPYEVWTREPGGTWRQRSFHGERSLAGAAVTPYEPLDVTSFDGTHIQGWLLKPPGFDATQKYPLILYIHGGPHTMYGESFFHEFQMLAGAGHLVLITNPRGSTGYGEAFANVIQYRYPGDDYRDLMACVDAVVARGYVDERRLGVAGGSGGGLLTAWTIGQTTRFAAALVERPVVNWTSEFLATDIQGLERDWFRALPWEDPQEYWSRSPLSVVDRVRTPVLVIQSEQDYRTPVDQGLQYHGALKALGKPSKLVLFPASSHGLSRAGPPSQRIERLELIRDWFATLR